MDALKALSIAISLGEEKYQLYMLVERVFSFQTADENTGISALESILINEEFRPFLNAGFCEVLIELLRQNIAPNLTQMLLTIGKNPPDTIKEFEDFAANIRLYGRAFGVVLQQGAYEEALSILAEYERFLRKIDKLSV